MTQAHTTGQERALKEALKPFATAWTVWSDLKVLKPESEHVQRGPQGAVLASDFKRAHEVLSALPHQPATDEGEALGEALFKLSARLNETGWLADNANHAAYEAVVVAFNASQVPSPAAETRLREAVVHLCDAVEQNQANGYHVVPTIVRAAQETRAALTQPEPVVDLDPFDPKLPDEAWAKPQPEPTAQQGGERYDCDMGIGCDEVAVCFAKAQGQPDRCTRTIEADKDRAADLAHDLGISCEDFTSGKADVLARHLREHRLSSAQQGGEEEPTWPEWASSLLAIMREYTGPCPEDGYEGVDLPEELRTWFEGYRDELIRTGALARLSAQQAAGEAVAWMLRERKTGQFYWDDEICIWSHPDDAEEHAKENFNDPDAYEAKALYAAPQPEALAEGEAK